MLKQNESKIEGLVSSNQVSDALAAALRGEGTELGNKAVNSTGGSAAAWKDSVGQVYHIDGFDLIESDVRVYKRERPKEYDKLITDGCEKFVADGNVTDANGKDTGTPLGEYALRAIAYVAALVSGGDRSSISVTALQSACRNKWDKNTVKGKKFIAMSAPTPGDFVAQFAGELVGRDITLLDYQEKDGRFKTKTCIFGFTETK